MNCGELFPYQILSQMELLARRDKSSLRIHREFDNFRLRHSCDLSINHKNEQYLFEVFHRNKSNRKNKYFLSI